MCEERKKLMMQLYYDAIRHFVFENLSNLLEFLDILPSGDGTEG